MKLSEALDQAVAYRLQVGKAEGVLRTAHTTDGQYSAVRCDGGPISIKRWRLVAGRPVSGPSRYDLAATAEDWDWVPDRQTPEGAPDEVEVIQGDQVRVEPVRVTPIEPAPRQPGRGLIGCRPLDKKSIRN